MNQEHYEAVREAVIKAVPEILNLDFGCRVEWEYDHFLNLRSMTRRKQVGSLVAIRRDRTFYPKSQIKKLGILFDRNSSVSWIEPQNYKVLGRPIRLADVLFAMATKGVMTANEVYLLNIVWPVEGGYKDVRWNLRADDLSLQSPETIEFLYELLK